MEKTDSVSYWYIKNNLLSPNNVQLEAVHTILNAEL